jgi:hypothetical protein
LPDALASLVIGLLLAVTAFGLAHPFADFEAVKKRLAQWVFAARERSLSVRSMLLFLPSVFWPLRFLNLTGG